MGFRIFGVDTSDPANLQGAIKAAGPLMQEVENRAFGILNTLLDRLDGATITINLKPIPKATAANPPPD